MYCEGFTVQTRDHDGGCVPSPPSKCVTVQHCAQAHGISLGVGQVIVIAITATLAAIGAASIPMSALVSMITVLQAVRALGRTSLSSPCETGTVRIWYMLHAKEC